MARRPRSTPAPAPVPASVQQTREPEDSVPRWVTTWWPGLAAGLFFARWWMPTEGTDLGDTLFLVQGWLLLGVVWAVAAWWKPRRIAHLDGWSVGVLILIAGQVLSAVAVLLTQGQKRAASTWMWEWIATGLACLMLRSLLNHRALRREWLVLCLTAGVTLAGYGVSQQYYFYPQLRQQYTQLRTRLDELERQAPEGDASRAAERLQAMTRLREEFLAAGLSPEMLEGRGRAILEGRLQFSMEPLGRFALANTFAGLLLVIWLLLCGVLGEMFRQPRKVSLGNWAFMLVCWGVVGYCLIATKSRTAFVGAVCGVVGLGLLAVAARRRSVRTVILWGGGACLTVVVALGIAWLAGSIDRQVFTETPKSLQYRLEYWWSTLRVIEDSPLLGVGSGQFRQHYLAYKLPQSSEEIADPHNLVLDVWANGGLIALFGLIWLCAWGGWRLWGHLLPKRRTTLVLRPGSLIPLPVSSAVKQRSFPAVQAPQTVRRKAIPLGLGMSSEAALRWGAWLSCGGLWLWSLGLDHIFLAFAAGWGAMILAWDRWGWDDCPDSTWGVAAAALGVHLLGAGGIAMPAISQLWLLCLLFSRGPRGEITTPTPTLSYQCIRLTGTLILCAVGIGTGVWPATHARREWEAGDFLSQAQLKLQAYHQAAKADPWAPEPWERLSAVHGALWMNRPGTQEQEFRSAAQAMEQVIRRNPLSFHGYRQMGFLHFERAKREESMDARQGLAGTAAEWYGRARARYPDEAELLAELALAQQMAGDVEQARKTARLAIAQHEINAAAQHFDKFLPENVLRQLRFLTTGSTDEENAQ